MISLVLIYCFLAGISCSPNCKRDEPIANISQCVSFRAEKNTTWNIHTTEMKKTSFETFTDNLYELENTVIETRNRTENEIRFDKFRVCSGCGFNFVNNLNLRTIQFHESFVMPKEHLERPIIKVRGNKNLEQSSLELLAKIAAPNSDIQVFGECSFPEPIKSSTEYEGCTDVFGDMIFDSSFKEIYPKEMHFKLDGCLNFTSTSIKHLLPFLSMDSNCSKGHVFVNNPFLCTDEKKLFENSGHVIGDWKPVSDVKCFDGECYGGYVKRGSSDRLIGCDFVKNGLQINAESEDLSGDIYDISSIRKVEGALEVTSNSYISKISMPILKHINSSICPALVLYDLPNLELVIFHPSFKIDCPGNEAKIRIESCPKLKLHNTLMKRFTKSNGKALNVPLIEHEFEVGYLHIYIFGILSIFLFLEMRRAYKVKNNRQHMHKD